MKNNIYGIKSEQIKCLTEIKDLKVENQQIKKENQDLKKAPQRVQSMENEKRWNNVVVQGLRIESNNEMV